MTFELIHVLLCLVAMTTSAESSRPRGAVGFGLAAVESAAASVVALTCGVCVVGGFGWL